MTLGSARTTFAAFPLGVQAAMRAASVAEAWTGTFWIVETALVAELLARSGYAPAFAEELAGLYRAIGAADA